jgi:hypothetical protein
MATQPEHKPNGHPPMADDQASAENAGASVVDADSGEECRAEVFVNGFVNETL